MDISGVVWELRRFLLIIFFLIFPFIIASNTDLIISKSDKLRVVGISEKIYWGMNRSQLKQKIGRSEQNNENEKKNTKDQGENHKWIFYENQKFLSYTAETGFAFASDTGLVKILLRIPVSKDKDCEKKFSRLKDHFQFNKKLRQLNSKKINLLQENEFCKSIRVGQAQWVVGWIHSDIKQKILLSMGRIFNDSILVILESPYLDSSRWSIVSG